MLDGSWLMAQGSWLMAKGGQGRLMAHGQGPARPRGPRGARGRTPLFASVAIDTNTNTQQKQISINFEAWDGLHVAHVRQSHLTFTHFPTRIQVSPGGAEILIIEH